MREVEKDQLLQIFDGATWDGNLISKATRTELQIKELIERVEGWNIITPKGVREVLKQGWRKGG